MEEDLRKKMFNIPYSDIGQDVNLNQKHISQTQPPTKIPKNSDISNETYNNENLR